MMFNCEFDLTPFDVDACTSNISKMLDAPRPIVVNELADEMFTLPTGNKFKSSMTPYMIEPMNLVTSRVTSSIIFVSPARAGKSLCLIDATQCVLLKYRPSDSLLILSTADMARRYARTRTDRMIKKSPEINELLTTDRHKDNVLNKMFINGSSLWIGSPTPTNLSASDYKHCFWSDVDRGASSNADGDIWTQLKKRNQTFLSSGISVGESSPSRDHTDINWKASHPHEAPPVGGILDLYSQGDQRMYYWRCHDCDTPFRIPVDMSLFVLPNDTELLNILNSESAHKVAKRYASIFCPHCGSKIDYKHKRELNIEGKWVKRNPDEHIPSASFWLGGVAATFQSWEEIIEKYLLALSTFDNTGDESKLRTFFNVDIGAPYIPKAMSDVVDAKMLYDRCVPSERGVVPDGVRYILASVDIQKTKFVCQFVGIGKDNRMWLIDRYDVVLSERPYGEGFHHVRPASYVEDWDVLIENVIEKKFSLEDGKGEMSVHHTLCDSGGNHSSTNDSSVTENAYLFWKKTNQLTSPNRGKFSLIKGVRPRTSDTQAVKRSVLTKASSTARKTRTVGTLPLYILNTTMLKDSIMSMLKRDTVGAGYIEFPDWLELWFFKELTVEIRTQKGWENPKGRRNESLDLFVYTLAGTMIVRDSEYGAMINWENPPSYAKPWANNSNVTMFNSKEKDVVVKPVQVRRVRGTSKSKGR